MHPLELNVETLARKFVSTSGANPDQLVQEGQPQLYGTGTGPAFAVDPSKAKPLWTFYIEAATMAITMARAEIQVG